MKKEITIKSGIKELGIYEKNSDAWVSSRTLAEMFNREHFHVLRYIENVFKLSPDKTLEDAPNLDGPKTFNSDNFIKSTYINNKKRYNNTSF